jgi:hypothetical protein
MVVSVVLYAALAWHDHADVLTALAHVDSFISRLTEVQNVGGRVVRTVLSSGGVAGGSLVSEGQGYGMLITGLVANSLPNWHPRRSQVIEQAHQLYLGWQMMSLRSGQMEGARHTYYGTCQTRRRRR